MLKEKFNVVGISIPRINGKLVNARDITLYKKLGECKNLGIDIDKLWETSFAALGKEAGPLDFLDCKCLEVAITDEESAMDLFSNRLSNFFRQVHFICTGKSFHDNVFEVSFVREAPIDNGNYTNMTLFSNGISNEDLPDLYKFELGKKYFLCLKPAE